jgi:hypothetical protein
VIASAVIAAALAVGARAIALAPREHPAWVVLDLPQDIDPGANQRYDELRIIDDRGNEVPYVLDPDTPYVSQTDGPLAATTRTTYDAQTGETIVTLDLGRPETRVTSLHVATTQREFDRNINIESSNDDVFWEEDDGATIARFARGTPSLDVPLSVFARLVRVRIANDSDPPLRNLTVTLYGPAHHIVFIAQPHKTYALDLVHSVDPPTYDLGNVLANDFPRHFLRATVTNDAPLYEQRRISGSWISTIGFAIAIATLLVVCVVSLRYSHDGRVTKE